MSDLTVIQCELKAPKDQFNRFGGFAYRNAENIQDALKPILAKHGCELYITDEIMILGSRVFVRAICVFKDSKGVETRNSAYAEVATEKKGMDVAQITGSASSYARKYALSAMFLIGGEADPDSMNNASQGVQQTPQSGIPQWTSPQRVVNNKQIQTNI